MSQPKFASLILAAGAARRFGGCKHLAPLAAKPVLQHVIDHCRPHFADDIYVVTGAWHEQMMHAIAAHQLTGAKWLYNAQWQRGLSTSLAFGVSQLADQYDGVFVVLGDQIGIVHCDVQRWLAPATTANIVCSSYQQTRGVPALFNAQCYPALVQLSGDQGAKSLLYDRRFSCIEIAADNACYDIDTRSQLHDWQQKMPIS